MFLGIRFFFQLTGYVFNMILGGSVNVNAVHVNQALGYVTTQAVCVYLYAFLENMVIPRAEACFSA
jgi:hypothetical protein